MPRRQDIMPSPTSCPTALHTPTCSQVDLMERALYVLKRALCFLEGALYLSNISCQKSATSPRGSLTSYILHPTSEILHLTCYISANAPCISAKRVCLSAKRVCRPVGTRIQSPISCVLIYIFEKELRFSAKQHQTSPYIHPTFTLYSSTFTLHSPYIHLTFTLHSYYVHPTFTHTRFRSAARRSLFWRSQRPRRLPPRRYCSSSTLSRRTLNLPDHQPLHPIARCPDTPTQA